MFNLAIQYHNIQPVFDHNSHLLILGSFPSVKSRESEFFYAHPQNRFWKVISAIFNQPIPVTVPEKKQLLLQNGIALWDVLKSCDISGSADSSIKNAVPNDISIITSYANIKKIYTNGAAAYRLYNKYIGSDAVKLPSTSPANAAFSLERLINEWKVISFP